MLTVMCYIFCLWSNYIKIHVKCRYVFVCLLVSKQHSIPTHDAGIGLHFDNVGSCLSLDLFQLLTVLSPISYDKKVENGSTLLLLFSTGLMKQKNIKSRNVLILWIYWKVTYSSYKMITVLWLHLQLFPKLTKSPVISYWISTEGMQISITLLPA